jgi:hypothetical protein
LIDCGRGCGRQAHEKLILHKAAGRPQRLGRHRERRGMMRDKLASHPSFFLLISWVCGVSVANLLLLL